MPCGGHDVGMNVWVEDGDVMFYVSRSGMFDENNTLLKAGRFRLRLASNPFTGTGDSFRQILKLDDGAVYIKGKDTEVRLWADVYTSAVYMEVTSGKKTDATLDFWHQNRQQTVFDFTVNREGLDEIKQQLYNPIGGLRFGGRVTATGFTFVGTTDGTYASTDYRAWNFKATGIKKSTVTISLYTGDKAQDVPSAKVSRKRSAQWWHEYWQRSYIESTAGDGSNQNVGQSNTGHTLSKAVRNYELFRYMLGCNAYGEWPTKFNGGLFTFDPVYADPKAPFTPDYRKWGGGTMTAQNQRLVYWPMLKSGDTDMMNTASTSPATTPAWNATHGWNTNGTRRSSSAR